MTFAGQGMINFFNEHDATIHVYGTPCPIAQPITRRHHPYQRTTDPRPRCSKCKKPGHIRKNCGLYQCSGCQQWGPSHTSPNSRDREEAQKEWEHNVNSKEWIEATGGWGAVAEGSQEKRWRDTMVTWAGAAEPTNSEWGTYRDSSTSPTPPPTPSPSPLDFGLCSLLSDSSPTPSLLFASFKVSDIKG